MSDVNNLVFYRIEDGRVIEKGRRTLTDTERVDLHQRRIKDLASDGTLLEEFNHGRPADQQADAFSIGTLIVQTIA